MRQPGNTGNRSSLSRPHKRLGDNMDYDRVFEIALGILLALVIRWFFLGTYEAIHTVVRAAGY